jgi:hypothetical protein
VTLAIIVTSCLIAALLVRVILDRLPAAADAPSQSSGTLYHSSVVYGRAVVILDEWRIPLRGVREVSDQPHRWEVQA